jgi:hypothetical protein
VHRSLIPVIVFAALVAASVAGWLLRLAGRDVSVFVLAPAATFLVVGAVAAAGLAAFALLRRKWVWAAALVLAWPVALPLFLRALRRERSAEPEV